MTLAAALLGAIAVACSEDSSTAPTRGGISAAKGGSTGTTSVTVTATDPSYGDQGTVNLDVQVTGSGFDASAQAQWIESGDTVPSVKVKVNHTTFVSSTQVVANIDIAQDAPIADYNVAVALSTGKKGIGNELFTVTQAQPLGFDGSGRGINDLGQIVGTAKAGAFFWDPVAPQAPQIIGQASAVGIDQAGVTISGYTASQPVVWTRAPGGQWPTSPVALPTPTPYGGVAREMGSDPVTGEGKYIAGEACTAASKHGCTTTSPARWVRDLATGNWTLELLQPHPNYTGYVVRTMSANGQAGGWTIGSTANVGVVWDDASTPPTILLPLPGDATSQVRGIDPTGTLAVGWSHGAVGRPVYWKRNPSTGAWDQNAINLNASPCSANGQAEAASRDGIIIGSDCGLVVAWQLTTTGIQQIPVGGLGPGIHADGSANVQSGLSPYASGHLSNGNAVRWRLVFP